VAGQMSESFVNSLESILSLKFSNARPTWGLIVTFGDKGEIPRYHE
jgi:hypothetical protein